uniref:Uncharacterized protein n=1 Tax=Anguilla anguilla TaxID=7936 RepID=A0A0E9UXZ6_ANGAN
MVGFVLLSQLGISG